ncbi:MAG: hypothetical protein J6A27_06280 [Bacteroidales bacterium]|nr:hypothetical protein [Bacteroidales bacterium]
MDEMKNLAGMFSSMAQMLQDREDALVKRIALLEARVAGLEEKIREAEMRGMMQEEMVAEPAEVAEAFEESAEVFAVEEEESAEEMMEEVVDEVMYEEPEVAVEEQPEIEIEFEFEEEPEVLEPEDQDFEVLEPAPEPEDEPVLVVDKARPDWYDWEVDIPGPYIEDIRDGIGLNDRILFLNELFYGDEERFAAALSALNGMEKLVDAVEYMRERYPQWDEESDEVYRFYMTVRRRFNKQIQES